MPAWTILPYLPRRQRWAAGEAVRGDKTVFLRNQGPTTWLLQSRLSTRGKQHPSCGATAGDEPWKDSQLNGRGRRICIQLQDRQVQPKGGQQLPTWENKVPHTRRSSWRAAPPPSTSSQLQLHCKEVSKLSPLNPERTPQSTKRHGKHVNPDDRSRHPRWSRWSQAQVGELQSRKVTCSTGIFPQTKEQAKKRERNQVHLYL